MLRINNYQELCKKRDVLLAEKEKFYKKYFTREDHLVLEMITKEDWPIWDALDRDLFQINEMVYDMDKQVERIKKGGSGQG